MKLLLVELLEGSGGAMPVAQLGKLTKHVRVAAAAGGLLVKASALVAEACALQP